MPRVIALISKIAISLFVISGSTFLFVCNIVGNEDIYIHYDVPEKWFFGYRTICRAVAICFVFAVPLLWFLKVRNGFRILLILFLTYVAFVIICEYYLQTKWIHFG